MPSHIPSGNVFFEPDHAKRSTAYGSPGPSMVLAVTESIPSKRPILELLLGANSDAKSPMDRDVTRKTGAPTNRLIATRVRRSVASLMMPVRSVLNAVILYPSDGCVDPIPISSPAREERLYCN